MKTPHYIFLTFLAGLLGLVDAVYLLREHVYNGVATCTFEEGFGALFACDVVTGSQYAVLFGVPVALLGVVFYTLILLSVFLYRFGGSSAGRYAWWIVSDVGVVATLWFLYLQVFVLEAYCLYCLFSAFFVALISYGALRDYLSFKNLSLKQSSAYVAKEVSREETPSTS